MSRVNLGPNATYDSTTHEGGLTRTITPLQALRRSVLSCMLWEDEFYESGETIADRIRTLVVEVSRTDPAAVAALAVEARTHMKLRHVPLLIVREMARTPALKPYVAETLATVIQRADELAEFVAIYWRGPRVACTACQTSQSVLKRLRAQTQTSQSVLKRLRAQTGAPCRICHGKGSIYSLVRTPLSAQVKKGLARAFQRFNVYGFAKYNRDTPVKLRDVLFLSHAKPPDGRKGFTRSRRKQIRLMGAEEHDTTVPPLKAGEYLFKQIVDNTLPTPDTWEVSLSGGADKAETFTRLIQERKLGALAVLRNLRNMTDAKVSHTVIREALTTMNVERVLPFRFLAAARYAPSYIPELDAAMLKCLQGTERLPGTTIVLVDGSASMNAPISAKSEISRLDAAAAVAIICRALSEHCRTFVFSSSMKEAPAYSGIALADALKHQVPAAATLLGAAVRRLNTEPYDRLIVITDEQSQDTPPGPRGKGYVVNVASAKNGVGYGPWVHVDGWSERIVDFIREVENTAE